MKSISFDRLVDVVAMLRSENGCPWDLAQTHESLKTDLIEEAYELIEAIDANVPDKICDELGDLLMQVMLHSQIATDQNDVIGNLTEKLIRRHPHVFGEAVAKDESEVLKNWEDIKRSEDGNKDRKSSLDGIPNSLPSLQRAEKIQKKASRVGFDWNQTEDVLPKLQEEIVEIEESIRNNEITEIEMEIGDLLFSVVNLCRFLNVQPEEALRKSNRKFVDRFQRMETKLERTSKTFKDYDLSGLDQIWEQVKQQEKA